MFFFEKYKNILVMNGLEEWSTSERAEIFKNLTDELLYMNERMNLTALKNENDIISKHYADSMKCIKYIPSGASVLDVGTGAGFPALPIAILRPDVKVCALDSTAKKLDFIKNTALKFNIRNLQTINVRAEEFGKGDGREKFDVVVARAVARLNVLVELCLPLVKKSGIFISMKGASAEDELHEATEALGKLGGKFVENEEFDLLSETDIQKRSVIIIQKEAKTPNIYPRNYSQINKKPL